MNRKSFILLLLLLSATLMLPAKDVPQDSLRGTLRFAIDNIKFAGGTIWVGVYTCKEDFLDREKARLVAVRVSAAGSRYIEIPNMIANGEYALGIFHDENDNGEFDTNFLGLPSEPWAFSGKLKSRFRLPRFEEVSFRFSEDAPEQTLSFRTWF